MSEKESASDLEEGVEHLSRVISGVMTRLLGEKVTGQTLEDRPTISEDADEAITNAGNKLGDLLYRVGEAMESHPDEPSVVVDAVKDAEPPPDTSKGETRLAQGIRRFAGGLSRTAEHFIDQVSPRPEAEGEGEE